MAVMLSGVAIPVLAIWALRRLSAGRRARQATLIWVSGCFTSLLYFGVAYVFAVCWGGEIGESGKNRLVRAYGAPVVAGLEVLTRQQSGRQGSRGAPASPARRLAAPACGTESGGGEVRLGETAA